MIGETQEQFLTRVREALAGRSAEPVTHQHAGGTPEAHGPHAVGLPDDLEVARVVGRGEDVVAYFLQRVGQASMVPHRVADAAALQKCILDIAAAQGVRSALLPEEDWPGREAVAAALCEAGVTLLDPDDPDAAFTADVGITAADAAVAETGSMYLVSGGPRRRLASLAVPVHIGIVRAAAIVPDLLDLWSDAVEMPASGVLVSAPSKTADIELTLVMGVHGPRIEHVIVMDA